MNDFNAPMVKPNLFKLVFPFVLFAVLAYGLFSGRLSSFFNSDNHQDEIHYHAGFQVYKDNKLQDFSALKYMHIKPCTDADEHQEEEDEQIEKAHLHNGVGDVVHVHRENVVWADVFTNLNYDIDESSIVYLNNQKITNFLAKPIVEYDSLVVFTGENSDIDTKLQNAVTKSHIEEAEAATETCGE